MATEEKQASSYDILKAGLRDFDMLPAPKEQTRYFEEAGSVVAKIEEVKVGMSTKGRITRYVVVTFEITEAHDGPYNVGDRRITWSNLEDTYHQRDLRSMAAAVAHQSAADIDMNKVLTMFSMSTEDGRDPNGDICGEEIEIVLQPNKDGKASQKTGKVYVNPRFHPHNAVVPF